MANASIQRRLAAILAADVVGFSALMERDEEGTYARVGTLQRAIIVPRLADHQGRLIKTTGDGFLAEFASPIAALRCALAIQNDVTKDVEALQLRIGLNLGDVIIGDGGDIYGEGVNIAARLESLADSGGILISGKIHSEVDGKVEARFEDRGEQRVKNISKPVRIYAVRLIDAAFTAAESFSALQLPDKPSVAVLPFQNMSGDPEQEYFADGMVEDIITALSRFKSLFVIARNSSFSYKGRAIDIKQVGRELGVGYVLEGSVRKAGGRVRITGQLIEAATGSHLWADRFEGSLEDVFALQDQVTTRVVGQLISQVQIAEVERTKRKPTASMDAYDHHLRGLANIWKWTKSSNEAALQCFQKAIELDRDFALAYAFAGHIYVLRKQSRWMVNDREESTEAVGLSREAIALSQDDPLVLVLSGFNLAYIADELDVGAECIGRGLSLNPNLAMGWGFSGWVHIYLGEHERALEHLQQAVRLSPRDPTLVQLNTAAALAYFFDERCEEAARLAEKVTASAPDFLPAWRIMAIGHALSGNLDRAAKAARKVLELDPSAKVSVLVPLLPLRRPQDRERYTDGLLRAGLPE